eukprot:365458-Chlamydomonas_euryale.AAC.4
MHKQGLGFRASVAKSASPSRRRMGRAGMGGYRAAGLTLCVRSPVAPGRREGRRGRVVLLEPHPPLLRQLSAFRAHGRARRRRRILDGSGGNPLPRAPPVLHF